MANTGKAPPPGGASLLYRVLWVLVLVLVLVLAGGTLYALVFRERAPAGLAPGPPPSTGPEKPGGPAFSGTGRLRVETPPPGPATVIFSVTFPYDGGDRAFAEELASRIPDFRRIALDYLGAFPVRELRSLDEAELKAELLRRYNAALRLGQIAALYFNDFNIIE